MNCPSLKKLQTWIDDRCDLDDAEMRHVQNCDQCLQFLEQTSQTAGLEMGWVHPSKESYQTESEYLALQARLKELPHVTLDELADSTRASTVDDLQASQGPSGMHGDEEIQSTVDGTVDLQAMQAAMPDHRYALLRVLGQGGCGLVVLAFDTILKREVAIKFLAHNSELNKQRLSREGRILAELDHPNVVRVFDMGEFANSLESRKTTYLVMEYIEGGSTAVSTWKTGIDYREQAAMLVGVAQGLQLAHAQGLVHRDLKPANLLIDRDRRVLKVADFGLAKHMGESSTEVTQAGNLVGTPEYMSPEQIVGTLGDANDTAHRGVTPSTDIYSLGATLYALLTEQPPFSGNPLAILRQIPEVQPVAPSILNPAVPRSLELICLHAMEKIPSRRYASMQEFAEDLQRFVEGRPVLARTPSWWQLSVDWCARNKSLASTLLLLLCSLVAGVVGTTWMWFQASRNAEQSANYASTLEDNRKRLKDSVGRFQQRIFSDEAMHWQMTEEFRREMFTDVIKYLDEFAELLPKSELDLAEIEPLTSDYLMISKAAREVGRYDDARMAADRAVDLVSQYQAHSPKDALSWLYLQYRAASAAARARIPVQSFLDIQGEGGSQRADPASATTFQQEAREFADRCQRWVQKAEQQLGVEETVDVAVVTEDQFRWLMAKRESVLLNVCSEAEPSSGAVGEAIATFEQCLHELQRGGEPATTAERKLLIGELGWELAWSMSSRQSDLGNEKLFERAEAIISKIRDQSRSLEKQLTHSDWLQGITLGRKALWISQTGDLKEACEVAKLASQAMDRAIEMRPQNRQWIDESVRIELLYCDWLAQIGESEKAHPVLTNLIKKKLRLSKSAPNDYLERKQIIHLFIKLADLSRSLGNDVRAREEYYIAAQDCRIVLMNPDDQQWVLEVRPWLLSQVIQLDADHKFRDGPLALEPHYVTRLESMGLDGSTFRKVLDGTFKPTRPDHLQPSSIMDSLLQH